MSDRKEGNDQESINYLTPSIPRHQRERRPHKQNAKRTVSFPKIGQTATKIKISPGRTVACKDIQ